MAKPKAMPQQISLFDMDSPLHGKVRGERSIMHYPFFALSKNPHMERMEEEFLGVDPNSKMMDGPDMLEGGVWIIKNLSSKEGTQYFVGHISNRKY